MAEKTRITKIIYKTIKLKNRFEPRRKMVMDECYHSIDRTFNNSNRFVSLTSFLDSTVVISTLLLTKEDIRFWHYDVTASTSAISVDRAILHFFTYEPILNYGGLWALSYCTIEGYDSSQNSLHVMFFRFSLFVGGIPLSKRI